MMRHFVPLACLGTALLPAGALALGWRTYYYPCVPVPVASCPPVVYSPACPPGCEVYAPAPVYTPPPARTPAAPTVTQEPAARPEAAKPDAPAAPVAPPPKAPVAPMPGVPRTGLDAPEGTPAEAVRIPATVVPFVPATPSVPLAQPRPVEPASAVAPVPKVPAPVAEPGRFPLVPRVPGGEGGLPPLQIVPPPAEPSTSRSSPLADRPAFEVVPVAGAALAAGALRSVGIFNHTDRDVSLTVEGETVTLPKRSYVTASVPRKFAWRLDAGESRTTEVPAGSPGVEIVLRR